MHKKGICVLAAILIVAGACAPKANAPEDVAAIKAMATAWGQAQTAGDAAALSGQYADDAVRLDPNAPMTTGKEAILSALRAYFDRYSDEAVDNAEDVRVVGDLAISRGTYKGRATPKVPGAAVIDDKGKWLSIYQRQSDGSWKMIMDTWNSDLPPVQVLMPGSADELALLQIERDWATAWLNQDAKALDAILADDFIENYDGAISTKAQVLANIKARIYKVEACENSDMRAVVFGDHAVVNGLGASKQTLRGKDAGGKTRWMDTFIKREGRWQAIFTNVISIE